MEMQTPLEYLATVCKDGCKKKIPNSFVTPNSSCVRNNTNTVWLALSYQALLQNKKVEI